MKSQHQQRVEQFMRAAGQDVPDKPTMPSAEVRLLRARLIFEEALETIDALGCYVAPDRKVRIDALAPPDMEKIIDGCCDLSVVLTGTLSACGCPDLPFLQEVDANNQKKVDAPPVLDEFGKVTKPKGFPPPDIAGVLRRVAE